LGFEEAELFIMGETWIEGYWFLTTHSAPDHPSTISQDGIVYITYDGKDYEPNVFTYRAPIDGMDEGFSSTSELVTTREFDAKFSNYFVYPSGSASTYGITVGKFFHDGTTPYTNRFEGTVVLFSDGIYRRQHAKKIPTAVVSKCRKIHGEKWRDELLRSGQKYDGELAMVEVSAAPYNKTLGIGRDELGRLSLQSRAEILNFFGYIHPAALFGLAEASSGQFLVDQAGVDIETMSPSIRSVAFDVLRPAKLWAVAETSIEPEHLAQFILELAARGRAKLTTVVKVTNDEGKSSAEARVDWLVTKNK
jgi:hypothetical protein